MKRRTVITIGIAVVVLGVLAWALSSALERLVAPDATTAAPAGPAAPAPVAHITATLFYASQDGTGLVPVKREVPLAEGPVAQGRQILLAQFQAPPASHVSIIPTGTTLRAFYVTESGDAFVDLSREASTNHPGGSTSELLTVYAIVNAVTTNLPAAKRVQLLIAGKEADTLAGHLDIRRPLTRDASLVREQPASAPAR